MTYGGSLCKNQLGSAHKPCTAIRTEKDFSFHWQSSAALLQPDLSEILDIHFFRFDPNFVQKESLLGMKRPDTHVLACNAPCSKRCAPEACNAPRKDQYRSSDCTRTEFLECPWNRSIHRRTHDVSVRRGRGWCYHRYAAGRQVEHLLPDRGKATLSPTFGIQNYRSDRPDR